MGPAVPEGMFDLAEAPWIRLVNAVRTEALPDEEHGAWVVPGMRQAGGNVEAAIEALPGVREVAVIGAPHPDFGESVVAVIVGEIGAEAIGAALKERLAGYKRKLVRIVDALPRNAMGKVEKAALRRELADVFG